MLSIDNSEDYYYFHNEMLFEIFVVRPWGVISLILFVAHLVYLIFN